VGILVLIIGIGKGIRIVRFLVTAAVGMVDIRSNHESHYSSEKSGREESNNSADNSKAHSS
jgi:hypothetical protein